MYLGDVELIRDAAIFEEVWSEIETSSSLIIPFVTDGVWRRLMRALVEADLSTIQYLELEHRKVGNRAWEQDLESESEWKAKNIGNFLTILGIGRFSSLTKLKMCLRELEVTSLATAWGEGRLQKLRVRSRPTCTLSLSEVWSDLGSKCLKALESSFEEGNLPELETLNLGNNVYVFAGTLDSGVLLKSFYRENRSMVGVKLADMIPCRWFCSLETLVVKNCHLTSEQLCGMVDAILELPGTQLSLKYLNLEHNFLKDMTVDALVRLASSDRLRQLQNLNLSSNYFHSCSLKSLVRTIHRGHLPKLQTLTWKENGDNWGSTLVTKRTGGVDEHAAEAIVQAFFENEEITTMFDIDWVDVDDLSLEIKAVEFRNRNLRLAALKENHTEELQDVVPLTSAKVFLCGYPEVGKTRLRKTLCRPLKLSTKLKWETRPHLFKEPRTRGIELSRIEENRANEDKMTLILWDLAGQDEYHVLHGTFLTDLGFAGGKATTFVVVFRSEFQPLDSEAKLKYWLRFAAASSLRFVKRHVVIVLNCFGGRQCTENAKRLWTVLIKKFRKDFGDLLDIYPNPFIIDVRIVSSVKPLKDHIFTQARGSLKGVVVPRVCFELQRELTMWSKDPEGHLPILSWLAFENGLSHDYHTKFSRRASQAGASYLHEIGELIYFNQKILTELEAKGTGIVVPNPEWFCRRVVGQLLLPKDMLKRGESVILNVDGSIPVLLFQSYFENLLVQGTQSEDVILMLERLGLCYRKGNEDIIIPALISQDDYNSLHWEGTGFHWVMGRSLATEDRGRSAIPMSLFRQLQVELALDPHLGGRGDSEYRAGKSYSSFKVGALGVLVQFDVDHMHPDDDRVDILVKRLIRGDPGDVSLAQVQCICKIQQKLEVLCVGCCPGLRYDIKVIRPWAATQKIPDMTHRELMSLREIKDLITNGEEHTSWQLNGNQIELRMFLSGQEWEEIMKTRTEVVKGNNVVSLDLMAEQEYDACEQYAVTLGLLTEDDLPKYKESEEQKLDALSLVRETTVLEDITDEHSGLIGKMYSRFEELENVVRKEGHLTRRQVDKMSKELLLEMQNKHGHLVRLIQAQQSFSFEEKESSVPRYLFLARDQGKSRVWISLREAFKSSFQLHLLCEAHFDDGFLHEVKDQVGIKLEKNRDWLEKISPWLQRSLRVALFVTTLVGDIYLPGFSKLLPSIWPKDKEASIKVVDSAATMLLEEGQEIDQVQDGYRDYGTAAEPIKLKERLVAEKVVEDLIKEIGHATFAKNIGLRKVVLRATVQPHIGTSEQNQPSVVWICNECNRQYGQRATDITTYV